MTSREKVLEVERQVRMMIEANGVITKFQCPFCGLETEFGNAENNVLCCNEASEVVDATLNHVEHIGRVDTIDEVLDRFSGMQQKHVVN